MTSLGHAGYEQALRLIPKTNAMSSNGTETMTASDATAQELELARLIVATLNLETNATAIMPLAPLYRDGLGLDSIDILELALAISKTYGVQLRSDDKNNLKIFSSLRSLEQYIQQHRTK